MNYGITRYRGKPAFTADGQPVSLPSYCSCGPAWRDAWLAAHQNFARHGCQIFWLMPTGGYNGEWGTTPFWTGPGQFPDPLPAMPASYCGLDWQATELLKIAPAARFFVRMMDMPPAAWYRAYPDECVVMNGRRVDFPSLASEAYLPELSAYLQSLTRHCERAAWSERVIGYVIYPLAEGGCGVSEGYLFDQSPAMTRAFRAHLRAKYATDAALRSAWGDAAVTLETAAVPAENGFRQRGDRPPLFWPEATQVQPERDYFEAQRPLFRRYLKTMLTAFRAAARPGRLCGIDALKGNMVGWMTHPIFTGHFWKEHYGDGILNTGTTGMAEILDWPEFDLVATPHDYRCRGVGFGYDPEGIGDSVQLHGKIMMVEEDARSYANSERGLFGSIEPGEEEAILYRNLAAALSKGQQTYPMDVCVGYFEAPEIQRVLARRRELEQEFLQRPRQEVPCVTMLVDESAACWTDFSSEYNDLAVIRQRIGGLNHCGVPTRTFLWDDLARADFPVCHKLYLLPNCYRYTAEVAAVLRAKLFRDGNVIVFGPGSGITDGATTAPDFAQAMLGIDFELFDYEYPRFVTVDNFTHPLTAGCGASEVFGDSHRYGPVLVPRDVRGPDCTGGCKPRRPAAALADGGFTRLGSLALDNGKRRPGLVVKEFGRGATGNGQPGPRGAGDYAVVFTAAVPLPAWLLRQLARYSGTHVYDEADDVVYADSSMVAVHAVKRGARVICLPRRCRVRDVVTGGLVAEAADRITWEVAGPVTRWFALDDTPASPK